MLAPHVNGSAVEPLTTDLLPIYPLWFHVCLWILIAALSLITIGGNLLVLSSYYVEKAIRQPSNYLIFSLAVSDLVIGVEGFPFFTIYVLQGERWHLGHLVCNLWLTVDYTTCLTSIFTVLLITVDRYCSVCYTAQYRRWQTSRKIYILIAVSWVSPALLFVVMIFGWESFTGSSMEPDKCYVPFLKNPFVNMILYLIYYWAVLVAIVILYKGIHKVARELEERGEARDRQKLAIMRTQRCITQLGVGMLIGAAANQPECPVEPKLLPEEQERLLADGYTAKGQMVDYGTMHKASMTPNDKLTGGRSNGRWVRLEIHRSISSDELPVAKPEAKVSSEEELLADVTLHDCCVSPTVQKSKKRRRDSYPTPKLSKSLLNEEMNVAVTYQQSNQDEIILETSNDRLLAAEDLKVPLSNNRPSVQFVEMDVQSVSDSSLKDDKLVVKQTKKSRWLLSSRNSSVSWRSSWTNSSAGSFVEERGDETALLSKGQKSGRTGSDRLLTWTSYIFSPSWLQNWRRKKSREERRARKAFRTITVIVGAFALFWSPFYLLATIYGFCATCIPPFLFTTSYYMCYLNSTINPAAYALANRQFKRVFGRILKGDLHRR